MKANFSPRVRVGIYVVTGVLSLVVGYLKIKGLIGDEEVGLWAGLSAFANGLSAFNVNLNGDK